MRISLFPFSSALKQYPLLFRLVRSVMLVALLIVVVTSALQLWMAYRRELVQLRENLENLRISQVDTLTNNLWNFDSEGLAIQLHNIRRYPDMLAVVVHDSTGTTWQEGEAPENTDRVITERFPLVRQYGDESIRLGEVTLYADTSPLRMRAWRQVASSLLAELIALLLTGGCILAFFIIHFNRHINRIAEFAEHLELDTLDSQLKLERKGPPAGEHDELDRIVFALNDMRRRIREGMEIQQRMERSLQLEKSFIDAIINSLPGIFVVYDENMCCIRWNDLYQEKLGVPDDKVTTFRIVDRVMPEQRKRFLRAISDLFDSGGFLQMEVEMLSSSGREIPYLMTGRVLEIDGKKYLVGLGTDITERKHMEDELRQGQKMEAIGTLAGGIAHDFNNILSVIIGNLQLAQAAVGEPDKLQDFLKSGVAASMRARDLVKRILAISRRGVRRKRIVRMSSLVADVLELLRATIPATIDIRQRLDADGCILADPTEIHQVVMNLCTNGYQAMEGDSDGTLSVSLEEQVLDEPLAGKMGKVPPGRYLRLSVSDTGCGMDDETLAMIFEPYFTTRESREGTGLGLAVVLGIVREHDGYIAVDSEPWQGTTFSLFLPEIEGEEQQVENEGEEEGDGTEPDGSERILLVDDEQDILNVFSTLLQMHGYTVNAFLDPRKALDEFRQDPAAWDLVITDMTMPGMTGDLLREKITAVRPELPVVLCTGYSKVIDREQALQRGFSAYLAKPVESRLLLQVVREALDGRKVRPLRLLLVDDDAYNRQIASLLLQQQGHRVSEAANGEEALARLAEIDFDGVLMDMQMGGGLSGPETTKIIRAAECGKDTETFEEHCGCSPAHLVGGHLPIVAMTGNLDAESRKVCLDAGMDGFLGKPFTMESVAGALGVIRGEQPRNTLREPVLEEENPGADLYEAAISYMREVYPLQDEQLQQLIAESVHSLQESLQAARQAVIDTDLAALGAAAHRLKGTLLGLGLEGPVARAKEIELSAKAGEEREYDRMLEHLSASLQPLLEKESE